MRIAGSKNKPSATGVYLYVPDIFDPELFPELFGCENEANWLLHKIITTGHRHKHSIYHDGMSHISRETMKEFMGPRKASIVRTALLNNRVIECDESYQISNGQQVGYSQSYCLSAPYVGELQRVECTSKTMAAKIRAHRLVMGHRPITETELERNHQYLFDWLRKTKIDKDAAYQLIDQQPDEPPKTKKLKVGKKGRKRIIKVAIPSPKTTNKMCVETIYKGEWEFHVCPYGRVHTNNTRLFTECRASISAIRCYVRCCVIRLW